MRSLGLIVAIVVLGATGCRQRHLIKDFGDSYDHAFAVQHVQRAKPAEAAPGLDSQEAAITADNYRAGLVPEGQKVQEEPTIIVAPPMRERREQLAPSVPKE